MCGMLIICNPPKNEYVRSCPSNVYLFLELFQVQGYIYPVDVEVFELCRRECTIVNVLPWYEEIFELGCIFMEEQYFDLPLNIVEGPIRKTSFLDHEHVVVL